MCRGEAREVHVGGGPGSVGDTERALRGEARAAVEAGDERFVEAREDAAAGDRRAAEGGVCREPEVARGGAVLVVGDGEGAEPGVVEVDGAGGLVYHSGERGLTRVGEGVVDALDDVAHGRSRGLDDVELAVIARFVLEDVAEVDLDGGPGADGDGEVRAGEVVGVEADTGAVVEGAERGVVVELEDGVARERARGGARDAEGGGGLVEPDVGDGDGLQRGGRGEHERAVLDARGDTRVGRVDGVEDVVDRRGAGEVDLDGARARIDGDDTPVDAVAVVEQGEGGVAIETPAPVFEGELVDASGGGVGVGEPAREQLARGDETIDDERVRALEGAGARDGAERLAVGAGRGLREEREARAERARGALEGAHPGVQVQVGGLLRLELDESAFGELARAGFDGEQLLDQRGAVDATEQPDSGGDPTHLESPAERGLPLSGSGRRPPSRRPSRSRWAIRSDGSVDRARRSADAGSRPPRRPGPGGTSAGPPGGPARPSTRVMWSAATSEGSTRGTRPEARSAPLTMRLQSGAPDLGPGATNTLASARCGPDLPEVRGFAQDPRRRGRKTISSPDRDVESRADGRSTHHA